MRNRSIRLRSVAALLGLMLALMAAQGRHALAADDPAPDVTDTEWAGQDGDMIATYRFEKGGVVAYTYQGRHYRNGTWKQDGAKLEFEMNKGYRTFKGTIKGDLIEGDSENQAGNKWQTTIYKYTKPN